MKLINLSGKNNDKNAGSRLREIGGAGTGVFTDYEAEKIKLNRPRKITDYRDMLRDGTVEALFNILTMPILASEYDIKPADESTEAKIQAEFVRNNLLNESYKGGIETPFDLFLDQSMMALVDGFQVWEKVYRLNNNRYELKKLALRDSRSVEIQSDLKEGYQGIRQTQEDGSTVDIPAYKTFLFTPGKRYDQYYGRSIFTALWRNYDKKWKLEYLDSIALQNDAIKPKVLKNTGNTLAKDDDKVTSKVLNVLSRLGKVNSMATLPQNYELEVLNSEGRDPHQSIERQNSEMARVFLANFMLLGSQGTSSTGSFALSDTQAKMFRMSLESVMNKLAAHINQYIIADLIDINFSEPRYPVFAFEKLDNEVVGAIFNAFTTMIQKDRMSDAMASEIEDATATRLGFDVEKIKQQRTEQSENTENNTSKEKEVGGTPTGQRTMSDDHKHEPSESLKKLDARWQELEKRFLDQIRPVYEAVAEEVSQEVANSKLVSDIDAVVFPVEYRRTLVSFFKQGYQIGKISASDEMGKPAAKNGNDLTKAAIEYINWIIEKQQDDLTNYAKSLVMDRVVLDDKLIDYSAEILKLILAWFATKLTDTASYAIAQAVNSGRNSVWDDDDVLEFSAILDARTSPGCSALDGKVMTWKEWQAYPEYIPPRHFNCRSTFTRLLGDNPEDEINPPNNMQMHNIEKIQRTPKPQLIEENPYVAQYTKAELLSVETYKGNGFININQTLLGRRPMNEYAEADIKQLDKAIKKTKLEKGVVLYRGIGLESKLSVNDIVDNPNFLSTSTSQDVSIEFARQADGNKYVFIFKAPKDMPYLDMEKVLTDNGVTSITDEDEYLLSRGKKFVVKRLKKLDNEIIMADMEMTKDTKYLADESEDLLTDEMMASLNKTAEEVEKRLADPNYKPSRAVQRMHAIWQMDSEYLDEQLKKQHKNK